MPYLYWASGNMGSVIRLELRFIRHISVSALQILNSFLGSFQNHKDLRSSWNIAPNNHCFQTICNWTMSISSFQKFTSFWPAIIFILCYNWNIDDTKIICCLSTDYICCISCWSCWISANSRKKQNLCQLKFQHTNLL